MAQRIPRDESLSRVHGVGACSRRLRQRRLLDLLRARRHRAFALGLTPVAFVISGLIFAATAATYAEATVMYPEAGGSSSFARHAFNEFVSFIAAWGQMLNYTITVAISAYFVPHYLAVFWEPLGTAPGDIIGGAALIAALALINIRGTEESAKLNLSSPSPTSRPRCPGRDRRRLVLSPESSSTTSTSASPRPGATSRSASRSG
jgi:hypothetical protein